MDIWEWLDISPTTDIAKIKSAYAQQAKLYHPEEHPEEFKALQNAYKLALRIAKSGKMPAYVIPTAMSAENEKQEEQEEPERSFDFSGIDSYGNRERFFNQFILIVENPYLCNNTDAWEYFLEQKEYKALFENTDFRLNLVRTMCSYRGWRRKTIVFFERYLNQFHKEENKPADGKWETQLTCFRIKKIPFPRLPAFCTDRFLGKEGKAFHKKLHAQISSAQGRKLNLTIKDDLINYMRLYFIYGGANADTMKHLHKEWLSERRAFGVMILAACLFVLAVSAHSLEKRKENDTSVSYLMELYGLEEDGYSQEEKEKFLTDYDRNWKYAEEAIDETIERYIRW
ncbi:MAG: J domain-containing protein [Bacillus sp. (in: Bacteria)]|nr:J domain-containing protein [Bacillus sp. (in: firmicutes)]MCM1428143.1 J domain-containing protein [Eubacterium sp.]